MVTGMHERGGGEKNAASNLSYYIDFDGFSA